MMSASSVTAYKADRSVRCDLFTEASPQLKSNFEFILIEAMMVVMMNRVLDDTWDRSVALGDCSRSRSNWIIVGVRLPRVPPTVPTAIVQDPLLLVALSRDPQKRPFFGVVLGACATVVYYRRTIRCDSQMRPTRLTRQSRISQAVPVG